MRATSIHVYDTEEEGAELGVTVSFRVEAGSASEAVGTVLSALEAALEQEKPSRGRSTSRRTASKDEEEKPARSRRSSRRSAAKDDEEEEEKPARGRGRPRRSTKDDEEEEKPARGRSRRATKKDEEEEKPRRGRSSSRRSSKKDDEITDEDLVKATSLAAEDITPKGVDALLDDEFGGVENVTDITSQDERARFLKLLEEDVQLAREAAEED